jgi:hypothetical protein
MRYILAILLGISLNCQALTSVLLAWENGEPPFTLEASRIVKGKAVQVFKFQTYNNKEVVQVNGTVCTSYKLTTGEYVLGLPRQRVVKNKMTLCK